MHEKTIAKSWSEEINATFHLGWPLVLTQLLHASLGVTDVIMMGWLGPKFLAAGGTAASFFFTFAIFGMGTVGAVSPLIAQAIGSDQLADVRRALRQGVWVSLLLATILILIMIQTDYWFTLLGQAEEATELAGVYLKWAAWAVYPMFIMVAFRSFLSGHNDTKVILYITITGFFVNLIGNYVLMFGHYGFPRLELEGAGITTLSVQIISTLLVILYTVFKKNYKHYQLFARFWRSDWPKFKEIMRVGLPLGVTSMSEVGLFSAAYFLMGLLSIEETAAHAVALQIASLTFMIPLGLSFATTVRVGVSYGAKNAKAIIMSGWVSIYFAFGIMTFTCLSFLLFPEFFVHFYLDPKLESNAYVIGLAVSYLAIAGIFQLVDGVQVICAGALRGLSDTTVPMIWAFIGYWLVGMPVSWIFAFELGYRGVGVWLGLAAGLAFAAIVLLARFVRISRKIAHSFD